MIEQTIQAADSQKKPYAKSQMKAYQVKHASIICTSGSASQTSTQNEEYETGSTDGWF